MTIGMPGVMKTSQFRADSLVVLRLILIFHASHSPKWVVAAVRYWGGYLPLQQVLMKWETLPCTTELALFEAEFRP